MGSILYYWQSGLSGLSNLMLRIGSKSSPTTGIEAAPGSYSTPLTGIIKCDSNLMLRIGSDPPAGSAGFYSFSGLFGFCSFFSYFCFSCFFCLKLFWLFSTDATWGTLCLMLHNFVTSWPAGRLTSHHLCLYLHYYFTFKNSSTVRPLFLISPRNNPGANSLWFGIDRVGLDSW